MAFRKKILMLATKISIECGTYMGVTPSDPEYMILDPVVTDEMADVGMHVKVRSPRHIEEIAKKAKVSVDYAQEQVNKLADCGIVRCIYDGDVETYYYPIWVPGIMEMVPAMGHRNLAPPYSRMSRMGSRQPLGTPFQEGSWLRDRWVLTIMVQ